MAEQHGWRLKRLGSLKIFIVLGDRAVEGGEPAGAGSIVIYRRNAKRPSVYDTIYDAWRSRLEIVDRYGADGRRAGEMAELAEARERIQTAGLDLLAEDGGSAGGRVTRRIGRVARDLKHKSNPLKSQARTKAQAGPVRTPKNRRVNRTATQARVTAIDSRLAERQEEIYSILPWIKAMETALRLEIDRCLAVVERLAKDCASIMSGHEYFRTGRTSPGQIRGLTARLGRSRDELVSLRAAPFLGLSRYLGDQLDQAISQIGSGRPGDAARRLTDVRSRCGRALVQRQIEDLLARASTPGGDLSARLFSELFRRTEALLQKLADPRRSAAAAEAAAHLDAARSVIGAARSLRQDGRDGQVEAQLDEFRLALKKASGCLES